MADDAYANIRDVLGRFIGATVVDITQHDRDEFLEEGLSYVELHFDTGATLGFQIDDDGRLYYNDPGDPDDDAG